MSLSELAGAALPNADNFTAEYITIQDVTSGQGNGEFIESETMHTALYDAAQAGYELASLKTNRTNERQIYRLKIHDASMLYSVGDAVNIDSIEVPFSSGNIRRIKRFADGLLSEIDIVEVAQ